MTTNTSRRTINVGGAAALDLRAAEIDDVLTRRAAEEAARRPLPVKPRRKTAAAAAKSATPPLLSITRSGAKLTTSGKLAKAASSPSEATADRGSATAQRGAEKRSAGAVAAAKATPGAKAATTKPKRCGCGAFHPERSGPDALALTRFSLIGSEPDHLAKEAAAVRAAAQPGGPGRSDWRDPRIGEFVGDHLARAREDRARRAAEEETARQARAEADRSRRVQRERRRRLEAEREQLGQPVTAELSRGMSVPCERHEAPVGEPCWLVGAATIGGSPLAGVCGRRLRQALPHLGQASAVALGQRPEPAGKGSRPAKSKRAANGQGAKGQGAKGQGQPGSAGTTVADVARVGKLTPSKTTRTTTASARTTATRRATTTTTTTSKEN